MFRDFIFLLLFCFFSTNIFGQDWNEIYYLETDAEYFIAEKAYEKAILTYERILKDVPNSANHKFKLGKTYLLTDDQKDKALEYFKQASENATTEFDPKALREVRAPMEAFLFLGMAYQNKNDFDNALIAFNKYKSAISADNNFYSFVSQQIKSCELAKEAFNNPVKVKFENLGDKINDENSNFAAVFSGDGQTAIFTSYTKNYIDIYSSKKVNEQWSSPKNISENVSKKYYVKTSSLSYDGTELYLVTDDSDNNDIFVSTFDGSKWTNAEKLGKAINGKKTNETHASVSKDGNTLYFTSNREGGLGGLDIYKSTRNAKGEWGEPENLGPNVNTEFNEETPFESPDGKYLFFSSQGFNSIGGYDIFYIDLDTKTERVHLGYPVNTPGDNLFFVPTSINSGYISMAGDDSKGRNDIYSVTLLPSINFVTRIEDAQAGNKITDSVFIVSLIDFNTSKPVASLNTSTGDFSAELEPGRYILSISNKSYEPFTNEFEIPDSYKNPNYDFTAQLNPIVKEKEPEPEPEVEPLVAEVVQEPEIIVEPEPEPVQEIIPEPVEEKKAEPIVEEKPEPVADKVEIPEKEPEEEPVVTPPVKKEEPVKKAEEVKYIPKTNVTSTVKTYSVQLMALKVPVDIDFFSNVDGVQVKKYEDGFYRYTVGNTSSYNEAVALKEKIIQLGYKDIFIRENSSSPKYTIQIMALLIPVEANYFSKLENVVITRGADDYYRYTVGEYDDYNTAKEELSQLAKLGYKGAYVKRLN